MPLHFLAVLICCIRFTGIAKAQEGPAGAMATCLGGMSADVFSPINNCALMLHEKKTCMGFAFSNLYGLKDLNCLNVSLIMPYKKTAYGSALQMFGNGAMNCRKLGIAFTHQPHPLISFGLNAGFQHINIVSYGHADMFTADLSIVYALNKQLDMSFSVFNLMGTKVMKMAEEPSGRIFRLSAKMKISNEVCLTSEAEKSGTFKMNIRSGCHYKINDAFNFSLGFSSLQARCSMAIGFKHKDYSISMAAYISRIPGVCQTLSFTYALKK